ncbi:MAG TPA: hypothetical protein VGI42_05485 [Chthoniobacterales bacterium]|jgi:hypothetical protein
MKQTIIRSLQVCALLIAFAVPSFAEESKRGFYESDLAGGGRIVFFVQGNHALSTYVFDTAGHQASFGGSTVADDGTFTLTTSSNAIISGTVTRKSVTATVLGQNITANLVKTFGKTEELGGRFTATASSDAGATLDVKVVIDSQKNIFLIAKQDTTVLGGFGTVTITPSPTPSPSPSPSASPSPTASPSASPSPTATPGTVIRPSKNGGDDGGGDDHGDHKFEDNDQKEDHHLDNNSPQFDATFTIVLVTGETVSGHLTLSHGLLLGDFTLNAVVFHFRAPQESSENHLANISTRGFVNSGQGQLIGGFIIRGGPKMVVIRALGPSLSAAGVSPVLADPQIQLFQDSTLLAQNDNWQSASNAADLMATTIPPKDPKEAAILIRLEPGNYTTVVSGADSGTGISLVEVYEIDRD